MQFAFKAVRGDGEAITGRREAADRFALARQLRSEGLTLVNVQAPPRARSNWRRWSRITLKDKIVFANSLAAMLGSGLSLTRSLSVLEHQATKPGWRAVIAGLDERIAAGDSLSRALASFSEVFPPVFIALIAAGEESGKLAQALEGVRDQLAKSYELRRKLQGAMIYPLIIILAMIITAIVLTVVLLPTLAALFRDLAVTLPLSTRLLIAVSDFMSRYYLTVLLAFPAAGLMLWRAAQTGRGRRPAAFVNLHLPVVRGLVRNFNSALTLRTLSVLLSSGVNLIDAINLTEQVVGNVYYRGVLRQAAAAVRQGKPLSAVFRQNESLYPPLVGEMAEVGEETGNLSGMFGKGAAFFENEVEQMTKNLSVVVEPVLMVLIGLAVGFFAVAVIGPIYSLLNVI